MAYKPVAFPSSFPTTSHHDSAASGPAAAQARKSRRLPVEWREGDGSTYHLRACEKQTGMKADAITKDGTTIEKP